jgi:hypothetical protein
MESSTFEKAFGNFIDRREYDEAQNALFDMVRIAFKAGWESAGGNPPESQSIIRLLPKKTDEEPPK